jgi:hypothetical protein
MGMVRESKCRSTSCRARARLALIRRLGWLSLTVGTTLTLLLKPGLIADGGNSLVQIVRVLLTAP